MYIRFKLRECMHLPNSRMLPKAVMRRNLTDGPMVVAPLPYSSSCIMTCTALALRRNRVDPMRNPVEGKELLDDTKTAYLPHHYEQTSVDQQVIDDDGAEKHVRQGNDEHVKQSAGKKRSNVQIRSLLGKYGS
eukprot:GHVT01009747.1.p1 GENE.GHVT01009747.1~~GHVT01009747.1.p1  ORF type:complete len:133 (-),score=4.57 GHVT01009747.1:935-1333(-)